MYSRAVNCHGVLLRVHDEDHAAAGVEPFEGLTYYPGMPVVRRDDLHRQVRRAGPVAFDGADLLQTLAANKGHIRGAHGVGVGVDFETCFGGVDTTETVRLDMAPEFSKYLPAMYPCSFPAGGIFRSSPLTSS